MLLIAARKKVPATPPPPTVQVTEVLQQDVPIYREWVGTLDGFVNADIKPQVAGYIQKQAYQEGSFVRQGAVLFLIDPRNYQDLADQAKSTLDHNIATLAKARLDVQRDKELIAAQAITRQQLDNDEAAEREAAANVESARAALRQAQLNRGWAQVTSPITGIVGIAQVQVGNLVNTSTTMTTVSQVDPIKAQFNISESEYLHSAQGNHWLEPGPSAKPTLDLILEDGAVYPHPGVVIVVNRQVSQRNLRPQPIPGAVDCTDNSTADVPDPTAGSVDRNRNAHGAAGGSGGLSPDQSSEDERRELRANTGCNRPRGRGPDDPGLLPASRERGARRHGAELPGGIPREPAAHRSQAARRDRNQARRGSRAG
jgi:RND family efflux transporter MFP subunit